MVEPAAGPSAVVAMVQAQTPQPDKVEALIQALDLSALSESEREKAQELLRKHKAVFSAHEGDLGCTNLIQHEIPLLDAV